MRNLSFTVAVAFLMSLSFAQAQHRLEYSDTSCQLDIDDSFKVEVVKDLTKRCN